MDTEFAGTICLCIRETRLRERGHPESPVRPCDVRVEGQALGSLRAECRVAVGRGVAQG